jgi:type II secretory pathway pseudopilin PulG
VAILQDPRDVQSSRMKRLRAAFTLLELLLACALVAIVLALVIPSFGSLFTSSDAEVTFERFRDFVRSAQDRAMSERRDFILVWEKEGILIEPRVPTADDAEAEVDMFAFGEGATMVLDRPVALEKKPPAAWPIWRSGVCEPVRITYSNKRGGAWTAEFDALTTRPRLIEMKP